MALCGRTIHKLWFKNLQVYQDQCYFNFFFLTSINDDHPLEDVMKNDKIP